MASSKHRKLYIDRYIRLKRGTTRYVPEETLSEAGELLVTGQYEEAIALLNTQPHIELDPRALKGRGLARLTLKKFSGAHQDFDAAERLLLRELSAVYCNRSAAYLEEKRYDAAHPWIEKALACDPGWYLPYVNKLSYHALKGEMALVWETLASLNRHWPEGRQDIDLQSHIRTDGILALLRAEENFSDRIRHYINLDTPVEAAPDEEDDE